MANQPDIMVADKLQENKVVTDLTKPNNRNIKKVHEKFEKYHVERGTGKYMENERNCGPCGFWSSQSSINLIHL